MHKICLIILTALTFLACHKSSPTEPKNASSALADSLIGTWKLTAQVSDRPISVNGNGVFNTDVFSQLSDCDRQYTYHFQPQGQGSLQINCNTEKQITWEVSGRMFIYKWGTVSDHENVISNSSTTLTTNLFINGYWVTYSYQKQ